MVKSVEGGMSTRVIIAGSYPHIKPALYLVESAASDEKVTLVVSEHRDLYKFFRTVNEKVFQNTVELVNFERYPTRRATGPALLRPYWVLPDIIRERRYIDRTFAARFAGLRDAEVYFFSRCYSPYTYYLLKKLAPHNRLIHVCDPSQDGRTVSRFFPRSPSELARLIITKCIFGHDSRLGRMPGTTIFCVPDKFYHRYVARTIGPAERTGLLKDFRYDRYRIFATGHHHVLYFDEGLVEAGYVDGETFRQEIGEVFKVITHYARPEEIARKYHPGYPSNKTLIRVGDTYPDFIPAELLYNGEVKLYMSAFSFALANVEQGEAVSIADLLTFKDNSVKESLRKTLDANRKTDVRFPQTLEELEQMVQNAMKEG